MIAEEDLLSDPVFQLNTVLWALQDIPNESRVKAVLKDGGYYLMSIGRRLQFPIDQNVRTTFLSDFQSTPSPTNPDIWLKHQTDDVHVLIELKAHGFGTESTNVVQARKFLVSAVDLKDSLGLAETISGTIIYLTTDSDTASLQATLSALSDELNQLGLATARSGCLGLVIIPGRGVALRGSDLDRLPAPMQSVLREPAIVLEDINDKNDLRPLYFIPWMPGIKDSQLPELHAEGLRELTARMLTAAASIVGKAQIPSTISINPQVVLEMATFGLFQNWHDSDRKLFEDECSKILFNTLHSTGFVLSSGSPLQLDLPDETSKETILTRIMTADPSNPSKNLEAALSRPPSLFDDNV